MFQILSLITSYGALMLLLMPATGVGILLAIVALVLGTLLIVCKKNHVRCSAKLTTRFNVVIFSVFVASYFGMLFYSRWVSHQWFSYYVIETTIETVLHMQVSTMLLIISFLLSLLSVYCIYVGLQLIAPKLSNLISSNQRISFVICLISPLVASFLVATLAQSMLGAKVFSMGYLKFIINTLIVLAVLLFLYCLLNKMKLSIAVATGIFMVISTINVYVYKFRCRLFEPLDVFSASTAMNVLENYNLFPIPLKLIIGWSTFIIMLVVINYIYPKNEPKLTLKKRLTFLVASVISFVAIFFYAYNLSTEHWMMEGASANGYILDFVSKFKEISVSEPPDYNIKVIDELAEHYNANGSEHENSSTEPPHIIVIMDESFSDLSVIGEFSTNMEVTPFISSLKENTISGYALSSVYGGNTANSEYEFLIGNTMAWFPQNSSPYQQYIRSSAYSMVSYLKSVYNYKCIAMHPFESSGWNRPSAYMYLGFDECYFDNDIQPTDYIRYYASDKEMFKSLIELYEAQKDERLFIFGVTIQNHGGYSYAGDYYTKYISLDDYADVFPDVEQYLSLIHETDKAVEYLIKYFETVDEDVVIVFFGDHQPSIDNAFYETVSGISADTLDEQQKRYKIPFFIWANYDIDEEYIDCTSLNYLSSYMYNVDGITLPPYNRFLQDIESIIPSINANGFYSTATECYLPFDEANEEEQSWLELYEALQYNNVFDKKHHNELLFPILE